MESRIEVDGRKFFTCRVCGGMENLVFKNIGLLEELPASYEEAQRFLQIAFDFGNLCIPCEKRINSSSVEDGPEAFVGDAQGQTETDGESPISNGDSIILICPTGEIDTGSLQGNMLESLHPVGKRLDHLTEEEKYVFERIRFLGFSNFRGEMAPFSPKI